MSGQLCFEVLDKMFIPKNKQSIEEIKGYTIKYGNIVDNGEVIDEVLVSYFKAPKSYTMENMCEINSHGGNIIVKKILELCLKNGAELAEPGEFTKRAFLNGRIDLVQAESVIDIINAKSEKEVKTGIKQLEGLLSKEIAEIKQEIMDVMINIEVSIDYPEYDVEDVANAEITDMLDSVKKKLERLERSFDNGKVIKEGIKTAIIGKPNAGKSSLLNAILKEDRAIVTEYEGTTRDTIEEFVNINGIPLKLIDTAGIRKTDDYVENIGVNKAKKYASEADLIIFVIDASRPLDNNDYEIMDLIMNKKVLVLLNKSDIQAVVTKEDILKHLSCNVISVSAKEETGIDDLENEIKNMFFNGEIETNEEIYITNLRHKNLLREALESLKLVKGGIEAGVSEDFLTIDMMNAYEKLGLIIGEEVEDDLADRIFEKFCMGK